MEVSYYEWRPNNYEHEMAADLLPGGPLIVTEEPIRCNSQKKPDLREPAQQEGDLHSRRKTRSDTQLKMGERLEWIKGFRAWVIQSE